MVAYVSGGKRRMTKGDEKHAYCIRKCYALLLSAAGSADAGECGV